MAEQQLAWHNSGLVEGTWPSGPAVTHLAQKQGPLVSLDGCCCRAGPAGAAGSCTGRCRPAAAAAGSGCRWCHRGRAQRRDGPSRQETGRRSGRDGCCCGDALSGTTPPQLPGPSAASGSPPPQPSPPHPGGDRGARPSPQHTSLPAPATQGHLQRGEGRKLRIWPATCLCWWIQWDHSDLYDTYEDTFFFLRKKMQYYLTCICLWWRQCCILRSKTSSV